MARAPLGPWNHKQNPVRDAVRSAGRLKRSPQQIAREKGFKVLRAPVVLDVFTAEELQSTIRYLAAIRRTIVLGGNKAYIDLSNCRRIGVVGCLMLTAELDHCSSMRPHAINGHDPVDLASRQTLADFGFYRMLGVDRPQFKSDFIVQMKSGEGVVNSLAQETGEVAALAMQLWGNQAYADRVHGALNEALTNVIMHAYPKDLLKDDDCAPRWWVAGAGDAAGGAWFVAMDHGVGVPRTAMRTMADLLKPYLANYKEPLDHHVLWATIKRGSSQTALPQHGKGFGTMISLVDKHSEGGGLWVLSGKGGYLISVEPHRPIKAQRYEGSYPLKAAFPGTLIVWRVNGPKRPAPLLRFV